jgi:hypothetical protein
MSMGGYIGTDPILTPGDLQRLAGRGELRFVMIGGFSLARPGNPYQQALAQWVRANGTLVDPALWRIRSRATADAGAPRRMALGGGYVTVTPPELYDIGSQPGP